MLKNKLQKKVILALASFFVILFSSIPTTSLAQPVSETASGRSVTAVYEELNGRKPLLEIRIPGLTFSNIASSSDETGLYFYISWIPELISAVYKFSIAIASIVAVVIIILQGVRLITSAGNSEATSEAYKKITHAIIGLFIAWGSFLILYTVNPNLVEFNPLKIKVVERQDLESIIDMQTTNEETIGDDNAQELPGSHIPTFVNCPIVLNTPLSAKAAGNPSNDERTKEFYEKIGAAITATSPAEKVVQVADAATKCGVRLGSCGRTAGTIYTLAGITTQGYTKDCLTEPRGCWTHEKAKQIFWRPKDVGSLMKDQGTCENICKINGKGSASCKEARKTATQAVTAEMRLQFQSNILNWPDGIANQLMPGDTIWIYNGNGDKCAGQHSAIFVGWAENGKAQVIQGQNQQTLSAAKPYQDGQVTYGTICLKAECGDAIKPLTAIFRPQ